MVWLGNISYPLYLLHQPIVRVVNNIHALNALGQAHHIILITGVVTFCCALSTLVFYAYDKVVRDRAARIFLQRPRSMTLETKRNTENVICIGGCWNQYGVNSQDHPDQLYRMNTSIYKIAPTQTPTTRRSSLRHEILT